MLEESSNRMLGVGAPCDRIDVAGGRLEILEPDPIGEKRYSRLEFDGISMSRRNEMFTASLTLWFARLGERFEDVRTISVAQFSQLPLDLLVVFHRVEADLAIATAQQEALERVIIL